MTVPVVANARAVRIPKSMRTTHAAPLLLTLLATSCAAPNPEDPVSADTAAVTEGRAAKIIGARAKDFDEALAKLGPLENQRLFWKASLPANFTKTPGHDLPKGVTAVVSYKEPTTNVKSFLQSIPADRPVIMIYHHEPEEEYGGNGKKFVAEFVAQSKLIRSVAGANVKVAMAAMTYQYDKNRNGVGCDYIPPPESVDYYLADNYVDTPDGDGLAKDPEWLGWLGCVEGKGKPLGLAEYGLGTGAGNAVRAQTMRRDDAYIKANFPDFVIWSYWWVDMGGKQNYKFTDAAGIAAWKSISLGGGSPARN